MGDLKATWRTRARREATTAPATKSRRNILSASVETLKRRERKILVALLIDLARRPHIWIEVLSGWVGTIQFESESIKDAWSKF